MEFMNFKECYKAEMDAVKKTPNLTGEILFTEEVRKQFENCESEKRQRAGWAKTWRSVVFAAVAICMIGTVINHEKVEGLAKSLFGMFTLSTDEEEMDFGEMEIVQMNMEKFIADPETTKAGGTGENKVLSYNHFFGSYEKMNQVSGIVLPCADKVEYTDITVDVVPEWGYGHISAQMSCDGASYNVNGIYAVNEFGEDSLGYGDRNGATVEKYEYGKDKRAYFLEAPDGGLRVYFAEEGILFQMTVCNGEPDVPEEKASLPYGFATGTKEQAKVLLDLFGE